MRVVNAEEMRRIEQEAMNGYGISSLLLMENAALAVVREIERHLSDKTAQSSRVRELGGVPQFNGMKAVVLVGKGNNGGDGLAVARHLYIRGIEVSVFLFALPESFQGDALLNLRLYQGTGSKLFIIQGDKQRRLVRLALQQADVVVDAIYGTGLRGALPSLVEEYVEDLNNVSAWVIAVDIPSGVEAGTGRVYRTAVRARKTVTFGLAKLGHFLGVGPEYAGELVVDPISIPAVYLAEEGISNFVLTASLIRSFLPTRQRLGHKGEHGRGVLVAGSQGMGGAAVLAGQAALRSGIGLLQMVAPRGIRSILHLGVTEATVWASEEEEQLGVGAWSLIEARSQGAQALAIGPGLAQNPELLQVIENVLRHLALPVLLDADALNLLALEPGLLGVRQGRGSLILTPHPGEMARLCQLSIQEVQANRLELAVSKAVEWEAIVVLKGATTIIAAPDGRAHLNPTGNPGLGTGGTGDVLTGSILGWLAQGVKPLEAACLGVYLHGRAGDLLALEYGWSGFTASQVAQMLPRARKELEG